MIRDKIGKRGRFRGGLDLELVNRGFKMIVNDMLKMEEFNGEYNFYKKRIKWIF